jgi:hypothetical protein
MRILAPIHPKAMPVILRTEEGLFKDRPLTDGALKIVAKGARRTPWPN